MEAALAYAMAGDTHGRRVRGTEPERSSYPLDTQVQSLWLPAIKGQAALTRKSSGKRPSNYLQRALPPIEYGQILFHQPDFLPLSDLHSRAGVSGGATRQGGGRRVPEDSRPQRYGVELLDGSIGTSGCGACECLTSANLTGR